MRNKKQGYHGTRLYRIWTAMKSRCYNKNHKWYGRYGGRGIKICDEWINDFAAFREWAISNGYKDDLSIDRIDNDKGYSPENCRWTNQEEQCSNTSRNRILTLNGKSQTMSQWAREIGVQPYEIYRRIERGMSTEEALRPKGEWKSHTRKITHNGKTQTIPQWANEIGVKEHVIYTRLRRGWSIEEALKPARDYKKL